MNKEQYLRELTETKLGRGRSYIIHSTSCPWAQVFEPDRISLIELKQLPSKFSAKAFQIRGREVKRWRIQEWEDKGVLSEADCHNEKINRRRAGRVDRSKVSEISQWPVCVTRWGSVSVPNPWVLWAIWSLWLSLCYSGKWLITSVPLLTLFVKRLVPDNFPQFVLERKTISDTDRDLLLFQNVSLCQLNDS